jgi:excisionase family DNA binding protein
MNMPRKRKPDTEEMLSRVEGRIAELQNSQSEVWYTTEQLAEYLHISRSRIFALHSEGKLPGAHRPGKRLLFAKSRIDREYIGGHPASSVVRRKKAAEIEAETERVPGEEAAGGIEVREE